MRLPRPLLPILLAALLLAACTPPPQSCGLVRAAELPLGPLPQRPLVDVRINGQTARLILDTGAATTLALTPATVARLGLRSNPRTPIQVSGIGGTRQSYPIAITNLRIGGLALPDMTGSQLGAELPLGGTEKADGMLGISVLRQFEIDLDVPHHRIALYSGKPCLHTPLPIPGPVMPLRMTLAPSGHLLIPVALDGRAFLAMLDTGAPFSMVRAQTVGVPPAALAQDRKVRLLGVGPDPAEAAVHRFDTLVIGRERFARPYLAVLPLSPRDYDLVIGAEYFSGRRMWISFHDNVIFVQIPPPH